MYIDKYRTFEKCDISLSSKFCVKYTHEKCFLSITENKEYINIYPNHIANIAGIFGKNASGKSSLLSLIGKKVDDRHRVHEIFAEEEKNPHKKIDLLALEESPGLDSIKFNSSYFLLYYLCKDSDGFPLFIFETNTPQKYIDIFENSKRLKEINGGLGPELNYYVSKGWFAGVFKNKQGQNIFLGNTQDYPNGEHRLQNDIGILNFQKTNYRNKIQIAQDNAEESKICLKRRTISLQYVFLQSQLKFLCKQMKCSSSKRKMYLNRCYTVSIAFASVFPSDLFESEDDKEFEIDDLVEDYRNFEIEPFHEWKKINLAFLNRYTWYLITGYSDSRGISLNEKKQRLKQLLNIHAQSNSYSDIKNYYYRKIELILGAYEDEDLTITQFSKTDNALEQFLQCAKAHKISCSYKKDNLLIEITKESDLSAVDFFFENFVDEDMRKNLSRQDSILGNFLDINIQWLSDGEREYLSLYTALDEQISMRPNKKQYIFLFDEIEHSMHPDLCRCLIAELINFLEQYPEKQFQIIIASHSPFIASDLLKENVVCLYRDFEQSKVRKMVESPFAQNIHTILKSQFFLDSFLGEYSAKCIGLILECLNCDKNEDIIQKTNRFLGSENATAPTEYLSSISEVTRFFEFIIQSIGEPLIRNELYRRISNSTWGSIEERILYYQKKIAELEGKND